jgi:uncharacterized membrane-anchored protein
MMEGRNLLRLGFLAVVALQVALLLVILVPKEWTLATGEEVVLQTVPVDPRDLFRGDYVNLRYTISTLEGYYGFAVGDRIYVSLTKRGDIWDALFASHSPPDGLYIKGRITPAWQDGLAVEYGIESYFVPEGSGHIIESASDVKVRVAIDSSGNAVIKGLLVDGEPFKPKQPGETPKPSPELAATPTT